MSEAVNEHSTSDIEFIYFFDNKGSVLALQGKSLQKKPWTVYLVKSILTSIKLKVKI